jgi:NAD(P)H dehydrogenase (quinone)
MSKTLILGATGRLSSLTADLLFKAAPQSLRLATSREEGLGGLRDRYPGAEVVQADWNERSSLVEAMEGVDRLMVVTPDWVTDESLVTPNIIAAAKAAGSIELLVRLLAMPPQWTVEDVSPEYLATGIGASHHMIARPLLDTSGLPVCYVNVPAWYMSNLPWFAATEVQTNRRLVLPAVTDTGRMWVSEDDIVAVFVKILTEPAGRHVGQEYVLTSDCYTWVDIARIFSEQLGSPVAYVDGDTTMREVFGDRFDKLMLYMETESKMYAAAPHRETIAELLGRPQQTLSDYIAAHLQDYR